MMSILKNTHSAMKKDDSGEIKLKAKIISYQDIKEVTQWLEETVSMMYPQKGFIQ
jgi:hypothetical protein